MRLLVFLPLLAGCTLHVSASEHLLKDQLTRIQALEQFAGQTQQRLTALEAKREEAK